VSFSSLCVLLFPLYTSLIGFLLRETGGGEIPKEKRERDRECENKQTYLLYFLKKEERGRE
jgi:hypothetical protein